MWFPVPVSSLAADHLCGLGGHNLSTWVDTQSIGPSKREGVREQTSMVPTLCDAL